MKLGKFKDYTLVPVCSCADVECWFLTQEIAGLNKAILSFNLYYFYH